jgi:hypothetical protein
MSERIRNRPEDVIHKLYNFKYWDYMSRSGVAAWGIVSLSHGGWTLLVPCACWDHWSWEHCPPAVTMPRSIHLKQREVMTYPAGVSVLPLIIRNSALKQRGRATPQLNEYWTECWGGDHFRFTAQNPPPILTYWAVYKQTVSIAK